MSTSEQVARALVSEITDNDMLELVELFVVELPNRVAAMQEALDKYDLAGLASLAHQLKGSAGGYGFPTITDAAKDVEFRAKTSDDVEGLKQQVEALVDLCHRAKPNKATA